MQRKIFSTFLCSAVVASCVFADVAKSSEPNSPLITGGGGATSAKSLNSGLSSQALGSQAPNDELSSSLSNGKALNSTLLASNSSASAATQNLAPKATQTPHTELLALNSAPNAASKGIQTVQEPSQILLAQNGVNENADTIGTATNSATSQNAQSYTTLAQNENSQTIGENTPLAQSEPNTYQLGAVEVTAPKEVDYNPSVTTITAKDMKDINANDIGSAIRMTPGVFFREGTSDGRMPDVSIRGYDRTQIGLFMDGIPVADIYTRSTDYIQFATQGIASMQISRGFTSPVYGMNTLGGAINLVSARPQKELEINLRQKLIFGRHSSPDEIQQGISIGTNQGKYYIQVDASHTSSETFNFSSKYKNTLEASLKSKPNAYYHNKTIKLKFGYQPNENHEYSLNYYYQKGDKAGLASDTANPNTYVYAHWPRVDKWMVYLLGNSFFTPNLSLNTRLYYQDHYNSAVNPARYFQYLSDYDDDSFGGILTLSYDIAQKSNFKVGVNIKRDHHLEPVDAITDYSCAPTGSPSCTSTGLRNTSDLVELTSSIFAQYAQGFGDFRFVLAGSYDRADALRVKKLASSGWITDKGEDMSGFSLQGIAYYDISEAQNIHLTIGKKENLPSLHSRYTSQAYVYELNPNLKPETAINYEIGYDLAMPSTRLSVAAFFNDMTDMFVTDSVAYNGSNCTTPSGTAPNQTCSKRINADEGYTYGAELGVEQGFFADNMLTFGVNYSYVQKYAEGLSSDNGNAGRKITDYPNHMLNAKIAVKPIQSLEFIGLATYESAPLYTIGTEYQKGREYIVFDLTANYEIGKGFSVNAGVLNLTDRDNFTRVVNRRGVSSYYHLAGRRWFVGMEYKY